MFTRFDDVDGNSFTLVGGDDFVREIETERRAASERLEAERRAAQEVEIAKQVQARLFPQTLRSSRRSNTRYLHSSTCGPVSYTHLTLPTILRV